ncbi:alpha-L-rhamnosidase, partial [Gemmiger formicilis]|nr:alpha-L-rhamnosidase [Gemmiger formicilis]
QAAAATLNQMVVDNGYHLNTGFLSTPFLCGALAQYGYTDTAYRLLLQPEAPGWLYEVNQGANTVWETWTGIDAEGKPHESLNHYSYGAICGWLFGGVCGIHLADEKL